MKPLYFFIGIFLLFSSSSLFAAKNYTREKAVFLPQEFYVGDLVELRIKIIPNKGFFVSKPDTLPNVYWLKIEKAEITTSDNGYELRISFRSYFQGIRTLPPIKFGDITLKDIKIQTKSVLEDNSIPFSPIKEQMLLPGTTYFLALTIGVLFFLPVFLIAFWLKIKNRLLLFLEIKRRKKAYKKIIGVLKYLQNVKSDLQDSEFFTILIKEIKLFLSERGSQSYLSATMRECSGMLSYDFKSIKEIDSLIPALILADEVKFGDRKVETYEKEEVLKNTFLAIDAIETSLFGGVNNVGV